MTDHRHRTIRFLPVLAIVLVVAAVLALDHCATLEAREHCREHPFVDCERLLP